MWSYKEKSCSWDGIMRRNPCLMDQDTCWSVRAWCKYVYSSIYSAGLFHHESLSDCETSPCVGHVRHTFMQLFFFFSFLSSLCLQRELSMLTVLIQQSSFLTTSVLHTSWSETQRSELRDRNVTHSLFLLICSWKWNNRKTIFSWDQNKIFTEFTYWISLIKCFYCKYKLFSSSQL